MAKSGLVSEITKLSKQKMIPAIIVDTLGKFCSIRLSTNGRLLKNLRYFGNTPSDGDFVYVDYRTGTPIVYTSASNLESTINSTIALSGTTKTISYGSSPIETINLNEIFEAPVDDKIYGRKNSDWEEITGATGVDILAVQMFT